MMKLVYCFYVVMVIVDVLFLFGCWHEKVHGRMLSVSPRWISQPIKGITGRKVTCGPDLANNLLIGQVHENPNGTIIPQRKSTAPHSSPTSSQSEGDNATSLEVLSEESGSQSDNCSGGSVESASGFEENATTPRPAVGTKDKIGAWEEPGVIEAEEDITTDDTMVQSIHLHEFNLMERQQLRSVHVFKNGVVNNSGSFKNRSIMPEARVGVADIISFPDIYRIFQMHQFEWINNAPGEFYSHLTREFYALYVATLMNFVVETKTTKWGQKDIAITDNSLSPSLASMVACLMAWYPVNVGRIIASELLYRALNERAGLPFPCLIGKLCRQANTPAPNRLVDRWSEASRLTQAFKIKDVSNHLFGAKIGAVGSLAMVSHVPLDIPHADRRPEKGESSEPST
uniref:Putative plant transposon protein domain-containing protein n=1 Tax=Solanum tuberosum TaxID=4113 RepID=M1DW84_SOLTU